MLLKLKVKLVDYTRGRVTVIIFIQLSTFSVNTLLSNIMKENFFHVRVTGVAFRNLIKSLLATIVDLYRT